MNVIKRETAFASSVSNFIATWLTRLSRLIAGILVARSLGPELKGQYSNLALILDLYLPFLLFGYEGGVLYYGLRQQIDLRKFFWTGLITALAIGSAVVPILYYLTTRGLLGNAAAEVYGPIVLLALGACPVILANMYCQRVFQAYHLFRANNIRLVVGSLVTLGYYGLVALISHIDLKHAVIGFVAGLLIQFVSSLYFVIRYVGAEFSIYLRDVLKPWNYGIRSWLTFVIGRSSSQFDQIALTFLLLSGPYGIYTVGISLCSLVAQIPNSYLPVFFNQVSEKGTSEALPLFAKAQRITFVVTAGFGLILAICSFPLVYILYGSEYLEAASVIWFYLPGLVFQCAAQLSVKLYAGLGRPFTNSLIYLAGFLVSLPFYFILIPQFGIIGAAISSSIGYGVAFMFSFWMINREFGLSPREITGLREEDWEFLKDIAKRLSPIRK